jgi:hypothetical protein
MDELEHVHRLLEVVADAELEGRRTNPLRPVARHHDHGKARPARSDVVQQVESRSVGKAMIEYDRCHGLTMQDGQGLASRHGALHPVRLAESKREEFLNRVVVFHDEDKAGRGCRVRAGHGEGPVQGSERVS